MTIGIDLAKNARFSVAALLGLASVEATGDQPSFRLISSIWKRIMASWGCSEPSAALYQGKSMKPIHMLAVGSTAISIGLLFLGASTAAGVGFGLSLLVELVGSILTGKQSNEGPE